MAEVVEPVKWYWSKTVLVNLLGALAIVGSVFYPPLAMFIQDHLTAAGGGWAIINLALRILTKRELSL